MMQDRKKIFALAAITMLLMLTGCGDFFVSSNSLVTMSLSPAASVIGSGQTFTITATGTDGNNNTKDVTSTAKWSSSNSSVATVAAGVVTVGSLTGSTTITASQDGIEGTATITVTASPLASLAISPTTPAYDSGTSQQFTATGTLNNGSTVDLTSLVQWSSSSTTTATISSTGNASFITTGTTTITAKVNTGSSSNVTATLNITVQ
jgi:hypothetical protein